MHFEIMKEQKDYIPQIATEISELLLKLYKELDVYYAKILKNEPHDDEEKILFDMVNDIDEIEIVEYYNYTKYYSPPVRR